MALVHDMAECIVGDIAPADNIPKAEKQRREQVCTKYLNNIIPTKTKLSTGSDGQVVCLIGR